MKPFSGESWEHFGNDTAVFVRTRRTGRDRPAQLRRRATDIDGKLLDVHARVDVSQLRHDAEDLVRRASSGEVIVITTHGEERAQLVPPQRRRWLQWVDIAPLFDGPPDHEWLDDVALLDQLAYRTTPNDQGPTDSSSPLT